jgi:hypothetical protein
MIAAGDGLVRLMAVMAGACAGELPALVPAVMTEPGRPPVVACWPRSCSAALAPWSAW